MIKRCQNTNVKQTYTSLLVVYLRSNSASGAIHLTGSRPCTYTTTPTPDISASTLLKQKTNKLLLTKFVVRFFHVVRPFKDLVWKTIGNFIER